MFAQKLRYSHYNPVVAGFMEKEEDGCIDVRPILTAKKDYWNYRVSRRSQADTCDWDLSTSRGMADTLSYL